MKSINNVIKARDQNTLTCRVKTKKYLCIYKLLFFIFSLFIFSCSNIQSIHYGDSNEFLCYKIYYNKKIKIKSFDAVEYHIYKFYLNEDSLYITSDNMMPPENSKHIMKLINNDSILKHEFTFHNKFPLIIEGKDENGYYYNYSDTIINIGYNNVISKKSKRQFDYIIKNIKKCSTSK